MPRALCLVHMSRTLSPLLVHECGRCNVERRLTSGGRYQRVMTYVVRGSDAPSIGGLDPDSTYLANPKSHNFTMPSLVMRILAGLQSAGRIQHVRGKAGVSGLPEACIKLRSRDRIVCWVL